MLEIGVTDAFEREYMQKFRHLAAGFGEFVTYERDRGARDVGLHLTHKLSSGKERASSALCWFQMKGIMAGSLSEQNFKVSKHLKLSLDVNHLKYWYLQPMPTYLVVYVESANTFLVMDIQKYVDNRWGRDVLRLGQKTATVSVPTESVLDRQAFQLLLVKSDVREWAKALGTDEDAARRCRRDYVLIWHFGTAEARAVEHRVKFLDWQSKTRSQFYIKEAGIGSQDWKVLREHWQYMMSAEDLEGSYPYLEFCTIEDESDDWWDDENEGPVLALSNGEIVKGEDCSGEFFEYKLGARLNDLGRELFKLVEALVEMGLVEVTPGEARLISVAPWHRREV